MVKQSAASVCPFVCTTYIFEPADLWTLVCVCVMTIARLWLTVEVIGRGQRSMSSEYGRGNAVRPSVWPRSSKDRQFFLVISVSCCSSSFKSRVTLTTVDCDMLDLSIQLHRCSRGHATANIRSIFVLRHGFFLPLRSNVHFSTFPDLFTPSSSRQIL